jgi:aryl-alcohol dehydrogenase-like predicted oxidoreductase
MSNTKAGRVALNKFDYSPNATRASVQRSLDRLDTTYLDCLYLHDVEFVTEVEVLEAIEVLFELKEKGIILNVGISAYSPEVLTKYIESIKSKYGKVPDVVQNYAHFTIQNTTLNNHLDNWRNLGVSCIVNSSPLNMSLLSGKPAAAFLRPT